MHFQKSAPLFGCNRTRVENISKLPQETVTPEILLPYRFGNQEIATVEQKGKVKAKKKGTCYIYVNALNRVRTKIKITVSLLEL